MPLGGWRLALPCRGRQAFCSLTPTSLWGSEQRALWGDWSQQVLTAQRCSHRVTTDTRTFLAGFLWAEVPMSDL